MIVAWFTKPSIVLVLLVWIINTNNVVCNNSWLHISYFRIKNKENQMFGLALFETRFQVDLCYIGCDSKKEKNFESNKKN